MNLLYASSRSSARFLWICRHEKRVLQVILRTLSPHLRAGLTRTSPSLRIYLYGLSANLAHEPPLRFAPSRSSARFLWICRHEKRVLQVNLRTLFHTCNSQIILSLWKLRCTTSCFQAVLREFLSCFPLILRDFPAFCLSVIRCADHKKRHFFIQQ